MKKTVLYLCMVLMLFTIGCNKKNDEENNTTKPEPVTETITEPVTDNEKGEPNESKPPFELIEGAVFSGDISYGDDEETSFDIFYLPDNPNPSAFVYYIHGGGFTFGDKEDVYRDFEDIINDLLDKNIAFVSVNYRLLGNDGNQGVIDSMKDCLYGLQTIRYQAEIFNLDPEKTILSGNSAGAGTSLWIGLQNDLADLTSSDPIRHESSRVKGIAIFESQATYDLSRWEEVFWEYGFDLKSFIDENPILGQMIKDFYGNDEWEYREGEKDQIEEELDMCRYFSEDDPEIWVKNSRIGQGYPSNIDSLFHHPNHARLIHETATYVNVDVTAYYDDYMDPSNETYSQFIERVLDSKPKVKDYSLPEFSTLGKTSPNQKYIAYINPYEFETRGSLWILDTESQEHTKVIDLESDPVLQEAIKEIEWIDNNSLYYVQGFAFGTVTKGGELYRYDLDTKESTLVKRMEDGREIVHVNVNGDKVKLSVVTFDENYMNYTFEFQEFALDDLPLEEVYINENLNTGRFMVEAYEPMYNIRLISVLWDEKTEQLIDGEVLASMESAENIVLVVNSILPEGMPHEKLIWEDEDGNESGIYISYNGRTGNHYNIVGQLDDK